MKSQRIGAVWEGRVYMGTLDGRLVALNATNGALDWEVNTIDRAYPYTITGAPRIVKGKVIIGNGSPWSRKLRSPEGGDNLFLASILALRPDTGRLVWHYQTTPAENWDYTATQHIILADVEMEGELRKVLMQAPKNGFFYVLDRETGELISAEKYGAVTWASHVDLETGRPVETKVADYDNQPQLAGSLYTWRTVGVAMGSGLSRVLSRLI